jgi:formate dehydrogenase (NADP+) beta subunit
MDVHTHFNTYVTSLKSVLDNNYDAVFIGTGAPRGKDLILPGKNDARPIFM